MKVAHCTRRKGSILISTNKLGTRAYWTNLHRVSLFKSFQFSGFVQFNILKCLFDWLLWSVFLWVSLCHSIADFCFVPLKQCEVNLILRPNYVLGWDIRGFLLVWGCLKRQGESDVTALGLVTVLCLLSFISLSASHYHIRVHDS